MGMMMPGGGGSNGKMGYDRAIVTFSPDGRLFQVEYAREAIKRAATSIGIKFKDGVVLAGARNFDKLSSKKGNKKIHQIDESLGAASAGLIADGRVLIDQARTEAQSYRISYEEPIDVRSMAEKVGDHMQKHTKYGGLRPMGVSFLIGGYDEVPKLFETDVGGEIYGWRAQAIGKNREEHREKLEEKWEEGMNEEEAIKLAVDCLEEEDVTIRVSVINEEGYRELDQEEIDEHM